jgi:hypothetical protein
MASQQTQISPAEAPTTAPVAFPNVTWEMLEAVLQEMFCAYPDKIRFVHDYLSAARKMSQFMPAEETLHRILSLAITVGCEDFQL